VWRGANFNQSQKVADFIEFLSGNIPENAQVIIPSFVGDSKIFVNPYMQFYLSPRTVLNCLDFKCLEARLRDENTYFVIAGNFPAILIQDRQILMFDENWGLMPPNDEDVVTIPQMDHFRNISDVIRAFVAPLLWVAVLSLSGTLFVIILLPGQSLYMQIAMGYGLGLGVLSIGIMTLNLFGFQLNNIVILILTIVLLGVSFSFFVKGKAKYKNPNALPKLGLWKKKFDFWPLIFIFLGGIAMLLAIGKGYHRIDAIQIWGAKGYGIASNGLIEEVTNWGTNTLPYPLHIPILIASFRVLFGEVLPSSKIIFAGYYLATMMISYFVLLGMGVKRWISGWTVLLIFTAPIIFRHGTIGYANLPLTYYLLSGIVAFLSIFSDRPLQRSLVLSGVFFAIGAWTRPEGLMLSVFCTGMLLVIVSLDKDVKFGGLKLTYFLAPMMIYILFWQVVKVRIYPEPLSKANITDDALVQILGGNLHIKELFFIHTFMLQELVSPKFWGVLGILLLIAGTIVLILRKPVPKITGVMIASGCLFIIMIIGMYYLTSFDSTNDLSWWLTSGLNRMLFPGIIICSLGIIGAVANIFEARGS
jgi:hypothetical protein